MQAKKCIHDEKRKGKPKSLATNEKSSGSKMQIKEKKRKRKTTNSRSSKDEKMEVRRIKQIKYYEKKTTSNSSLSQIASCSIKKKGDKVE